MEKKKLTKLGAIRGSGDQHQTREPRTPGYERVRMERIKENGSKMKELGLKDQAKSLMALVQNNRGSRSKAKIKKVSEDNEIYQPNQDSDMEHELVSCGEELPIPHSKCNLKSKSIPWKIRKMKAVTQKSVKIASAFKKCRQKVHLVAHLPLVMHHNIML
ncbi:uncharacterized protein LOC110723483 [Chenopodium quinoa]|uniref:uncharacterized protein LOC110723483 n=1 Tax=Chenopodium quinoa TaxID=63459 RepID=UPI000B79A8C1|nr:uncharacterized protein LOC110723483 [Chenopodium quinoa]